MTEPRIQRACSGCRQKKIRCMPGTESDDCCRRCERLELECVVPEKRQRLAKSRLRGRVDQLENSYAQILSLLAKNGESRTHEASQPQDVEEGLETGIPTPVDSVPSVDNRREAATLSDAGLETSLRTYRRMSAENFPFVIVTEETTAALLTQKRPMLARAIAIVTSWNSPTEQSIRREQFLNEITSRYFIKCERSLDLLQALLVYFGWCHRYAVPFNSQAYRLGSLVVNMALELGINERPSDVTQHEIIMKGNSFARPNSRPKPEQAWSHEVGRAYIGVYTVSMYCSLLFRKPSPLTETTYLHEIVNAISSNPQQPSDSMMIHYLLALRSSDDVTRSFDQGSAEQMKGMYDGRIQVLLKALTRRLSEWKDTLPLAARSEGRLIRQILLARTYIHEVGLYHLLEGQTPSIDRIEILLECFNTTRDFLATVLALPAESMIEWNCMEWRSLNYAVIINSRSATILDSFCYCSESSQRAAWIDSCYDSLCSRTRQLARMADSTEDRFLKQLSADWANAKSYYHHGVDQALMQSTTSAAMAPAGAQSQSQYFEIDNMYNMSWSTFGGTGDWMDMESY